MKAIAAYASLPASDANALQDVVLPDPVASGHDLLVEVHAVSVNPVDTKLRRGLPAAGQAEPKVLGFDASGIVRAVGPAVTLFKPGDRVWYAGAINRPGSNSELQLVDERIVGRMPTSLGFAEAAALPLTAITAWELLFDRLGLEFGGHAGEKLLVVGAAGGVGSILVQLARQLTGITVIGTASRPETREWARIFGAQHVIDHSTPLDTALLDAGLGEVDYAISLTHTDKHFSALVNAIKPQGKLALIDDPEPIDVRLLKRKSISLHWELMFTRSLFTTPDIQAQHRLLNEVAQLVDDGRIRTTLAQNMGAINAENLRRAHAFIESGAASGKVVLAGF
ncbi:MULTISPECIES: zinc-binding alcohol dehydrogenase family protein [unclassified Massilia]|uniref:zinc-binding alcohol dehydrogenase family protein n=1 Tax=unclassified Massilia TaxID=2609279 RepID=UPI0017853218|nr:MULTISPECIES: zinc-binding alcohol dehydrogenase family protein [unclassified Massilia]MBD8531763.1 zinc-binding alcohol dehydrogenase family protein [Massilia sp. CFBP 13647]MBD8675208.1 zinc-binding alcohol dehydrogenase family protein [Massilia sp. CFBP 13721]